MQFFTFITCTSINCMGHRVLYNKGAHYKITYVLCIIIMIENRTWDPVRIEMVHVEPEYSYE